jgi:hypothetical protein
MNRSDLKAALLTAETFCSIGQKFKAFIGSRVGVNENFRIFLKKN